VVLRNDSEKIPPKKENSPVTAKCNDFDNGLHHESDTRAGPSTTVSNNFRFVSEHSLFVR
jgi:hypothetical protein